MKLRIFERCTKSWHICGALDYRPDGKLRKSIILGGCRGLIYSNIWNSVLTTSLNSILNFKCSISVKTWTAFCYLRFYYDNDCSLVQRHLVTWKLSYKVCTWMSRKLFLQMEMCFTTGLKTRFPVYTGNFPEQSESPKISKILVSFAKIVVCNEVNLRAITMLYFV